MTLSISLGWVKGVLWVVFIPHRFLKLRQLMETIGHFEKYHNNLLCASSALIGGYLFKSSLLGTLERSIVCSYTNVQNMQIVQ